MKRWWSSLFIVAYLGLLFYGLASHALRYGHREHMGMYAIVWDMFCGWDSFECRRHLIAQGDSGTYYDLAPPWQELVPYATFERHHYDIWTIYSGRIALNTLKNTDHEPINRIYLVEELWSKKYNMPDFVWKARFDDPKQHRSYYYIRSLFDANGNETLRHYDWDSHLAYRAIMNNPRLKEDVARSQPYMDANAFFGVNSSVQPVSFTTISD